MRFNDLLYLPYYPFKGSPYLWGGVGWGGVGRSLPDLPDLVRSSGTDLGPGGLDPPFRTGRGQDGVS